jgi:hypothetical protein
MLKRSTKDLNVWKKRYCVLVDKLWIVNLNGSQPKASYIKLTGQISVEDKIEMYNYPFCLAIQSPMRSISAGPSETSTTYIRASSPSEQTSWKSDILKRPPLNSANEIMDMAEIIICDYEFQQSVKIHQDVNTSLEHIINSWTQNTYNIEAAIEKNPTTIVFDCNMVEIECQIPPPPSAARAAAIYQSFDANTLSRVQLDAQLSLLYHQQQYQQQQQQQQASNISAGLIHTRSYNSYISNSSNPNIVYTPSTLHNGIPNIEQLSTSQDFTVNTPPASPRPIMHSYNATDNLIDESYNMSECDGNFDDAVSDDDPRSSDSSHQSMVYQRASIKQALYFRVHRIPTCSYVHRFYSCNPTLTNMISFLIDANRFKILFRQYI